VQFADRTFSVLTSPLRKGRSHPKIASHNGTDGTVIVLQPSSARPAAI